MSGNNADFIRETELKAYNEKIWLKHPDETEDGYYLFYKYFLSAPRGGRSVLGAYKRFVMVERGKTEDELKSLSVPKNYHEWSNARTSQGEQIVGLHTYVERANAYDAWVIENDLNGLLTKRTSIINKELDDAEAMLDAWSMMFSDLQNAYTIERQEAKKNKKPVNITDFVNKNGKIIQMRNDIAMFTRRAVGMMDKVTEDIIEKALEKDDIPAVKWVSPPKIERLEITKEDKAIDEMSVEEFEALLSESGVSDRLEAEDEE